MSTAAVSNNEYPDSVAGNRMEDSAGSVAGNRMEDFAAMLSVGKRIAGGSAAPSPRAPHPLFPPVSCNSKCWPAFKIPFFFRLFWFKIFWFYLQTNY